MIATLSKTWALVVLLALCAPLAARAAEAGGLNGRLASAGWLKANLAQADVRVLDASPASLHRKQHIPGAVSASAFLFGDPPPAAMEQRLRAWGISPGQRIVIYDEGGNYMAPKLFWDLVQLGLNADDLYLLDGGLSAWRAAGGALSAEPTPAPPAGSVRVTALNADVRVRLPEFLAATADPQANVMLEALEPSYYFGAAAFFNRAGHVPHATLMPSTDFFNADKTFKSPQQMRRMLQHLGVKPEQQVLTYCGGGGAAAVPFFALKYILDYPRVRLFQESQLGWLQDERELPFWTYSAPYLARDTAWLKTWASPMLKSFGLSRVSVIDLRAPDEFDQGHVPLSVNIPAQTFDALLQRPDALASRLGQAGVDASHEAVLVSDGGLNAQSALAFLALERLGQQRVSIYLDNVERWVDRGLELSRAGGKQPAAAVLNYSGARRDGRIISELAASPGAFERVYVASGERLPARAVDGRLLHLPHARFLNAGGAPKAAKDIWQVLDQAGMPRYAEVVLLADAPGDAAVNYVIFRLMGYTDLKVLVP